MKKIVILSMTYLPRIGGLQQVTHELANQYSKKGFEVHIITGTVPTHPSDNTINNLYVHRKHILFKLGSQNSFVVTLLIHAIYNLRAFVTLLRLKPEYVHCQTPYSSPAAWLVFKILGVPYSIGYHAEIKTQIGIMLTPNLSHYWKKLPYLMCSHNLFVLTEDMKKDLESGGLSSIVIPNGVNTDIYVPTDVRSSFKTNPTIIVVGRLIKSKAIDDAICVVSKVSEKHTNINMVIVGDGPERATLETLVDTLNLRERVSFIGRVDPDAMYSYYQKSHIFLQTSLTEGFPLVVLEAMACGLPIVSTNVSNIQELVSKANNGFITNLHDLDCAAQMIEQILDMSESDYENMCYRSRCCALEYSWESIADKYLDYYNL